MIKNSCLKQNIEPNFRACGQDENYKYETEPLGIDSLT